MIRGAPVGTVVAGYARARILHMVLLERKSRRNLGGGHNLSIDHVHHQSFCSPSSHPSVYSRTSRQYILLNSTSDTGQTQPSRRWHSTNTVEPPPAAGHLASVASSQLLRFTRETALRTPGLTWTDEDDSGPVRSMVGGRETRKMNVYQAVRDALRYDGRI